MTIKISAKFHPLIYRLPPNITHPFEENAKLEETHNSKNSKKKKKNPKTSSAAGAAEITTHFSLATDYHSCNNNNNNNQKIPPKSPLKRADRSVRNSESEEERSENTCVEKTHSDFQALGGFFFFSPNIFTILLIDFDFLCQKL